MARRCSHSLLNIFDYTTVKYVVTRNKKIGLLYRIFQLIILGYLIGWVFVAKKGYQASDVTIESSVVTKVKGVARVKTTDENLWGPEDYVLPEQGGNFIFIITNYIETPNQTLGTCPENPSVPFGRCTHHDNCTKEEPVRAGNGIKTGICKHEKGTCEIYGWCPIENINEPDDTTVVRQAENFTLYIRNFIRFSQFNFSASNIRKENEPSYLKKCLYDEMNDPYCPIFRLGDIVKKTGQSFQEMAVKGGSIGILVEWSCDLDKDVSYCLPHYSFICLGSNKPVTAGYNFRIARYFNEATRRKQRTLYKVFGIHIEIMVFGMARKFNIIPTIINIASVLTLMAAGSYICDILLLYMIRKKLLKRAGKDGIPQETPLNKMQRKFSL